MSTLRRIAAYGAIITATVVIVSLWKGDPLITDRTGGALLLIPIFAWVVWLRHDWQPVQIRKRRAERIERAKKREAWLQSQRKLGE